MHIEGRTWNGDGTNHTIDHSSQASFFSSMFKVAKYKEKCSLMLPWRWAHLWAQYLSLNSIFSLWFPSCFRQLLSLRLGSSLNPTSPPWTWFWAQGFPPCLATFFLVVRLGFETNIYSFESKVFLLIDWQLLSCLLLISVLSPTFLLLGFSLSLTFPDWARSKHKNV